MTKIDRVLSLAILLACALALYGVWLDRGEVDNLHRRLDSLDGKVEAFSRENGTKPARAPRKKKENHA